MTMPIAIIVAAFVVFLALYFLQQRRAPSFGTWWQDQKRGVHAGMPATWIFTLIALPIVLLTAKTSWLNRGIAFLVFVGLLALATAWSGSRKE